MRSTRCKRCNSPLDDSSEERTWDNACPECQQPIWIWTGDLVQCRVTRVTSFGAIVELEPGVEGLMHVTELGDSVQAPADAVTVDQQLRAVVLSIDPWQQKVGLSCRRLGDQLAGNQ